MGITRHCKVAACGRRAVDGSYCHEHATRYKQEAIKAFESRRPSSSQRGYTSKWSVYSKKLLEKHPVCQSCGKRKSELVDHIQSAASRPDLFWKKENHQCICRNCHSVKTHQERARGETHRWG